MVLSHANLEKNLALNKAMGVNHKVQQLCKEVNIDFRDAWVEFMNDRHLYNKDGIHNSQSGTKRPAFHTTDKIVRHEYM